MTAVASTPPVQRRARKTAPPEATFQAALVPDHKTFNGIAVVREEPVPSPLGNGSYFKTFCKLNLADGTSAWACKDCTYIGNTRGDVMAHRNQKHGGNYGKKPVKIDFPADHHVGDVVLRPRRDGTPAPSNIQEWTLAEFMSVAPSIGALGDLVSRVEAERDAAVEELNRRSAHDRANSAKLANYDALQEELVERRMTMKGAGSYEELKAEVLELRAWKKAMIKKLAPLGFIMSEEEN